MSAKTRARVRKAAARLAGLVEAATRPSDQVMYEREMDTAAGLLSLRVPRDPILLLTVFGRFADPDAAAKLLQGRPGLGRLNRHSGKFNLHVCGEFDPAGVWLCYLSDLAPVLGEDLYDRLTAAALK